MRHLPRAGRSARRAVGAAAVLVLTAAQSPTEPSGSSFAPGQGPFGSGHLSAHGIQALPAAGSAIDVDLATYNALYPDDPLNEEARRAAVRAMRSRGYDVVDESRLVLKVGVAQAPSPGSSSAGYPTPRRYAGGADMPPEMQRTGRRDIPWDPTVIPEADRVPEIYPQVRVPLGRRAGRVAANYTVTLTLFRRGEEPIWTATIEAGGDIPAPAALVRELTTAALDNLGTSVERDFTLSCAVEDVSRGGICLE